MSDLYQFPKAVWAINSLLLLAFAATAHADLRTSTDFTVAADTTDAGGQRTSSSAYTHHGSIGGFEDLLIKMKYLRVIIVFI